APPIPSARTQHVRPAVFEGSAPPTGHVRTRAAGDHPPHSHFPRAAPLLVSSLGVSRPSIGSDARRVVRRAREPATPVAVSSGYRHAIGQWLSASLRMK